MNKQLHNIVFILAFMLFPMLQATAHSVPVAKNESNRLVNHYVNYHQSAQNSCSLTCQEALFKFLEKETSLSLNNNSLDAKSNIQNDWVVIKTVDSVVVSYQENSCQGQSKLFIKIENNKASDVTVKWSFWGEDEYKAISVGTNETIMGGCYINTPVELDEKIPSGMTLTDLDANITVN